MCARSRSDLWEGSALLHDVCQSWHTGGTQVAKRPEIPPGRKAQDGLKRFGATIGKKDPHKAST